MFSVLLLSPSARTTSEQIEIKMCDLEVPRILAKANASFSVSYAIQVGDDGRRSKIEKVKNISGQVEKGVKGDLCFNSKLALFIEC
jgi:hypothetical protein